MVISFPLQAAGRVIRPSGRCLSGVGPYQPAHCEGGLRFDRKFEQTANPAQTTGFFGVKWEFLQGAVDAGFPLQYSDFPHRRALSSAG